MLLLQNVHLKRAHLRSSVSVYSCPGSRCLRHPPAVSRRTKFAAARCTRRTGIHDPSCGSISYDRRDVVLRATPRKIQKMATFRPPARLCSVRVCFAQELSYVDAESPRSWGCGDFGKCSVPVARCGMLERDRSKGGVTESSNKSDAFHFLCS